MAPEMTTLKGKPFSRAELDGLLRRTLFYTPSFEIYGGVAGFYDYGPPGCALNANIVDLWRKHFVIEENMLEVEGPMVTPHEILKTSGHVDRFCDWMVKDEANGDILRADHLVENVLEMRLKGDKEARGLVHVEKEEDPKKKKKKEKALANLEAKKLDDALVQEYEEVLAKIDNYDGAELGLLIEKYDIRNPATGNPVTPPTQFNLMFHIPNIGPSSSLYGFLRPETAQGQFLNFAKLLDYNNHRMPFASATIGKSFRNEISPRAGLLRVREFLMCEIEHFVDPEGGKKHARFHEVADVKLNLLDRDTQLSGKTEVSPMPIGEAVEKGIVDNETLGYFLARVQLFLIQLGCNPEKIRFRQHMATEMAHYATDCWDAELQTSYGWIECVGCADRSAYDLTVHMKRTGQPLQVRERLDEPRTVEYWAAETNKKEFGPKFRKDAPAVQGAIDALSDELREKLSVELKEAGKITLDVPNFGDGKVELTPDLITIEKRTRTENIRTYTPNVIEPSFGIGRILYALCEHVYWSREGDESRAVLSFPPSIAPMPVVLYPLSSHPDFKPLIARLSALLRKKRIHFAVDDSSASIGKRYSRRDQLGTPFHITADFESVQKNTFTLRERDSMEQVRATEQEIVDAVVNMVNGEETWEDVQARLPKFEGQAIEEGEEERKE
ncbi:glycyl-tRNA synthetase [Westerdykella ornata]|uniref:glycine--tRNA ligase n=1 Tax=Westerdykella ornata TaxID=318751 RepID=A0A6A6JNR3_WESOR|nr:glycyl-tRNA synthetase [Westerdykella ornata]KAF2278261.1 glycyl-tRNA synthetase [Westerdykella ornata]